MDAIIGMTGFVGSHLARKHKFDALFNTKNINEALGQSFSTVICAAAPGSMFEANKYPDRDTRKTDDLIVHLSQIKADCFILVSSIAVLADFSGHDNELTEQYQTELAYGRNRRKLELFCSENYKSCLILRLPALFGHKLKKNFIFDLLNPTPSMLTKKSYDELTGSLPTILTQALTKVYTWQDDIKMHKLDRNALSASGKKVQLDTELAASGFGSMQFTNPESTFQFYNIEQLWSDIKIALAEDLNLLHLATEPVQASLVHDKLTGQSMLHTRARIHHEDMYTRFAHIWGNNGPYLDNSASILEQLKYFFETEKRLL